LAGLLLVLFDGAPWGEERVVDVEVALTTLLAAEHAGGGFSNRRGERPDLETSALAAEALAALAGRVDGSEPGRLAAVRARLGPWLVTRLGELVELAEWSAAARIAAAGAVVDGAVRARIAEALASAEVRDEAALASQVHGLAVLEADRGGPAMALAARLEGALPGGWELLAPMSLALAKHASVPRRARAPKESKHAESSPAGAGSKEAGSKEASSKEASSKEASSKEASSKEASSKEASSKEAHSARSVTPEARSAPAMDPADWAFCKDALEAVSRTFSQPITFLPGELRVAVSLGYLLCRIADTIEDHPDVAAGQKPELFARFLAFMDASASSPTGTTLETAGLIALFTGVPAAPDDAELALARRIDVVGRVLMTLRPEVREILARWVCEMARGMDLYTRRRPGADGWNALYTVEDLDRYCYYV
ncbi:MAG: squalene/phytoene synthase family protein, partial [Deltaproteobacteria bacterium]